MTPKPSTLKRPKKLPSEYAANAILARLARREDGPATWANVARMFRGCNTGLYDAGVAIMEYTEMYPLDEERVSNIRICDEDATYITMATRLGVSLDELHALRDYAKYVANLDVDSDEYGSDDDDEPAVPPTVDAPPPYTPSAKELEDLFRNNEPPPEPGVAK